MTHDTQTTVRRRFTALGVAALLASGVGTVAFASPAAAEEPMVTTTEIAPSTDLFVRAGGSWASQTYLEEKLLVGGGREALLAFDVSGLPDDVVVSGARLDLYKLFGPNTTVVAKDIIGAWGPTTSYNTLPALGEEIGRQDVGGAGSRYSIDLTAGVRASVDSGETFDVHLTRSAAQNASEFASSRSTVAEQRPLLTIETMRTADLAAADAADLGGFITNPVFTDIALPAQGKRGSTVTWATSDASVVSAAGVVTRPSSADDATATLTATITSGDDSVTKDFEVVVRGVYESTPSHPQIHVTDETAAQLDATLANEPWATESLDAIKATIDPLANRHQTDPDWILSRMAMFWTEGERYTQVYIANQRFDRAEGDAPVPTVRYPAMRIWNDNKNAPLEQRLPYSEDGSMMNQNGVVVPYEETGHMIRLNNEEILSLAERAAFLYYVTDDEKYAKFAGDIYWQWLLGTYYMNPALDPSESLGGPGGYAPGGIGGYYDYEVIHDPMGGQAAVVYDFLYDYLNENVDPHLAETGLTLTEMSNEVFKRFIEIGMVRGGYTGNWNVNGWACIMNAILALEPNDYYADGKGREYYLQFYTTTSTQYHEALPDILKVYDANTGLWPESPIYAFGTIGAVLDFAGPIKNAGVDTIASSPVMQKAALAMQPWLDARGNLVVFGDGRGGPPSYTPFERLNWYYQGIDDQVNAGRVSNVLENAAAAGQYNRSAASYRDLLYSAPLADSDGAGSEIRTAYSPLHRHITQHNGTDPDTSLMATLYGGWADEKHLNPQGLAAQIYGKGWAVGPQAKSYESYWTADYAYSKGPAGANTVVPGYTSGEITVNGLEPAVPADGLTNVSEISGDNSFSDVTADGHRRQLAIVRTSPTTGYYVDVFRADQDESDYLWHNLGDSVSLTDAEGGALDTEPASDLGAPDAAYSFFSNPEKVVFDGDFRATWTVDDGVSDGTDLVTDMWMLGQDGRSLFTVDGLPTTTSTTLTPRAVNSGDDPTPTVIVRQSGNNAAAAPFASVFESYADGEQSVSAVRDLASGGAFVGLEVESSGLNGRIDRVLSSTDDALHEPADGVSFTGLYGVASTDDAGFAGLYLGSGSLLAADGYGIRSETSTAAALTPTDEGLEYSADTAIDLTLPLDGQTPAGADVTVEVETDSGWTAVEASVSDDRASVTASVPAGHDTGIRVDVVVPGPATAAPGVSNVYDTAGWSNGLRDGTYLVVTDLWWGQNATSFELYENDVLISSKNLTDASPQAQHVEVPITGKPNGQYVYRAVLTNRFGSTQSNVRIVNVTDANPALGVLSHDNWDGDGSYAVTFDKWWGTPGDSYDLYENDVLIETLTVSPSGAVSHQRGSSVITGREPGRYDYRAEFRNAVGSTTSPRMTVIVWK